MARLRSSACMTAERTYCSPPTILIGCMLSVFYVSADESEWESDREDMKTGEQLCYVKNIENEDCSEFGYICFKKSFGDLMQTA